MRNFIIFFLLTLLPVSGWSATLSCNGIGRLQEWKALLVDVNLEFDELAGIYTIHGLAAEEGHVMEWYLVAKNINEEGEISVVSSDLCSSKEKGYINFENGKWRVKFEKNSDDQKYPWEYDFSLDCEEND